MNEEEERHSEQMGIEGTSLVEEAHEEGRRVF